MKSKYIGSAFDEWLYEEGLFKEVTALAMKQVNAWQIQKAMNDQKITKTSMIVSDSPASLSRLINKED
jgi:hypothetical protein